MSERPDSDGPDGPDIVDPDTDSTDTDVEQTRTMQAVPAADAESDVVAGSDVDETGAWDEPWSDELIDAPGEPAPFEIRRRVGVYAALAAVCLLLAIAFVAVATLRGDVVAWVPAAVLAALGLYVGQGVLDGRTPLFVADAHGVRMRDGAGWVGLLWSEMADLRIEDREGRHDARIKVVSPDGQHIYTAPLGFATTVSVRQARDHLAARRTADGY